MPDKRNVDDLSLDELEALVEHQRRVERARRLAQTTDNRRFRPVTVIAEQRGARRGAVKSKAWRDRLLFAIEVIAVIGLLAIVAGSIANLQFLNSESAQLRAFTPTPTVGVQVLGSELPGSSFPPANSSGELPGGSNAPEPAPPALGVQPKIVSALTVPTPGPRSPSRLVIPEIKVDWPVVQGDSWEELKQGIGQRVGSANPGERGNLILSGHNDVYGEPFRDLEKIEIGKEIIVYAGAASFRYIVKAKRVVLPTDLSVLASSKDPIITLITCTPYRVDTHRLIVIGELAP